MKHIFLSLTLCLTLTTVFGQTQERYFRKFKVGITLGPTLNFKQDGPYTGFAVLFEPLYHLSDNLDIGVQLQSSAVSHRSDDVISLEDVGLFGATSHYCWNQKGWRPFIGAALGYADFDKNPGYKPKHFYVAPATGLELGHFRLNALYNILSEPGYNHLQLTIGLTIGGGRRIKN